jgi:hypothetical protein
MWLRCAKVVRMGRRIRTKARLHADRALPFAEVKNRIAAWLSNAAFGDNGAFANSYSADAL